MSIFDKIKNVFTRGPQKRSIDLSSISGQCGITLASQPRQISVEAKMALSTVFQCVNLVSNSVAELPLEVFKNDNDGFKHMQNNALSKLLNSNVNTNMSHFTFLKLLVQSMLVKGNGFALIERSNVNGIVKSLRFLQSDDVTIQYDRYRNKLWYLVNGIKGIVEPSKMIHLVNYSYDGINGMSTLQAAAKTLIQADAQEKAATGFFYGGCNLGGILKVETNLTEDKRTKLRNSFIDAFNPVTGQPNGIAILEGNMSYQPISINPADAQLLESRKFSSEEICRFFGVAPSKVFLNSGSYNSIEAENLAFLNNTLTPILVKIEEEFSRKLILPSENQSIRFNTSMLLRTSKNEMADYYSKMLQMGIMSLNEIRREVDMPSVEGGDQHMVQLNLTSVESDNNPVPVVNKGKTQKTDNQVDKLNNNEDGTEESK